MKSFFTFLLVTPLLGYASAGQAANAMQDCFVAAMESADAAMTVGSLRTRCAEVAAQATAINPPEPGKETLAMERIRSDMDIENRKYLISVHKPNYILAYTYNSELNRDPWREVTTPENVAALRNEEGIFQVSAKLPVWRRMFSGDMDLYFGYTQKSWWQFFTDEADLSAPFRESNYEPEVFARYFGGPEIAGGGRVGVVDFGYVHQSNGRASFGDGAINRSWDRMMGRVGLDWDEFAVLVRAWWAFEENDDTPNVYQYRGYGDIRAIWAPNRHTFTAMLSPARARSAQSSPGAGE